MKNERGGVELTDIRTFYNLYFSLRQQVIMMFPHDRDDNVPYNMAHGDLCPSCLHLNINENDTHECESCEKAVRFLRVSNISEHDRVKKQQAIYLSVLRQQARPCPDGRSQRHRNQRKQLADVCLPL
jgi:hypothetical protein